MEFPPVYVNSAIKTVINYEYDCDKSFQEIMCRIDNWINEGSVWVIYYYFSSIIRKHIHLIASEIKKINERSD